MRLLLSRPVRGLALGLGLLLAGTSAAAAPALEDVQEQREQLEEDLDLTLLAYQDAYQRAELTKLEVAELEDRKSELEAKLVEAQRLVAERARVIYKRPGDTLLGQVLASGSVSEAAERVSLLNALNSRDLSDAEGARALRTQLNQTEVLLLDREGELDAQLSELQSLTEVITADLEQTKNVETQLIKIEERKQFLRQGLMNGTYSCIFDPGRFRFTNDWGQPRSGGRSHKGTDVVAPYGDPVFAITDGTVARFSSGSLGGTTLYLSGDDGTKYYYAHLSGYAPGISPGVRVEAGEWIAMNGDSGNARGGVPHVHFQIHPGHGAAVNPFPTLNTLCYGR